MIKTKVKNLCDAMKKWTVSDWISFVCLSLLFTYCFVTMIRSIVVGRVRDCLLQILYLLVVPFYYFIEKYFRVKIPAVDAVILSVFMLFNSLGACYNFYTLIPQLDNILHAVWGLIFSILGFTVIKGHVGEPKTKRAFFAYVVFAFAFCCMSAVLWELFEFACDRISPQIDMQEDTIVTEFHSFLLYPGYDHFNTVVIDNIAKTVLYDADGNVLFTIEGGYLDTGVLDTMWDLIYCTVLSFIVCTALTVENRLGKSLLYRILIPKLIPKEQENTEEVKETEEAPAPAEEV